MADKEIKFETVTLTEEQMQKQKEDQQKIAWERHHAIKKYPMLKKVFDMYAEDHVIGENMMRWIQDVIKCPYQNCPPDMLVHHLVACILQYSQTIEFLVKEEKDE